MTYPTTGAGIRLENVSKVYPGQDSPAVDNVSLTVPSGEIVAFVGPSGCGKTTTLKMINRLIEPTSGRILIDGEDVTLHDPNELRRRIGYVIQGGGLLPHLTVGQNIALVPGLLKWDKKKTSERVHELLTLVGLDAATYRDRFPRELSGGQQQRVGVARGLAADPPVILMDEPFGAVDPVTRVRLQDELLGLQAELKKTIVIVTHDIDEAVKLGDRIIVFGEQAKIAQAGTPESILGDPASAYVADFVGAGAKLKRLSLLRVSDLNHSAQTIATVGEPTEAVLERAAAAGDTSAVVIDGDGRPRDWIHLRQLGGHSTVPMPETTLETSVDLRSTLHDALDSMLISSHGGAVVTDRGQYVGVVLYDSISDRIRDSSGGFEEVSNG